MASGFDQAIAAATARVVKLYGLGAGQQEGYGTGILVSPDGQVLTVLSLLIDAKHIRAVTHDGKKHHAIVIARDAQRHLALLRLVPWGEDAGGDESETGTRVEPLDAEVKLRVGPFPWFDPFAGQAFGPQDKPRSSDGLPSVAALQPGDWVIAVGNAFKVAEGAEPVSIARGIFSIRTHLDARRRARDFAYGGEVMVIDAVTSNPGAPGGAVVDLDGRLVGMIGRDVISNLTNTHFNYAIPGDALAAFVREAREGKFKKPAGGDSSVGRSLEISASADSDSAAKSRDLGLRLARTGYQKVLPFVERVKNGSPAGIAGVRADDLILSVNGKTIGDAGEFDERIKSLRFDEPVDLVIRRDRNILSVRIEAK